MSIIKNTEELNNLLDAVQKLPVKKDEQEKVVDITENGTTVVTPDEGMTLGGVTVNVEVESSGDDFIGIKITNSETTNLPLIVDIRGLPYLIDGSYMFNASCFNNVKEIYLHDNFTEVGTEMFEYCRNLEHIYGNLSKVTKIKNFGFYDTNKLQDVPYMPLLDSIGAKAFRNNPMTKFCFYKTPNDTIASDCFFSCKNLVDIYVPWVLDEVGGAPWGATNENLQIHYNTTYDENHNPIISEV